MQYADYIFVGDALFTAVQDIPFCGGVAIAGNRILDVGTREQMECYRGEKTQWIECGDHLIMPGFNDAHMHFPIGAVQSDPDYCIELMDCKSEEECVERVRQFALQHPDYEWIYGVGWYSEIWTNPHTPDRKSLDALNLNQAVCLQSFDLHSVWCNAVALKIAGISEETQDPLGGIIGRREDGSLSGMLFEPAATGLVTDLVLNVPTLRESLERCMLRFAGLGITSVADVFPAGVMNQNIHETYDALEKDGKLTLRIHSYLDLADIKKANLLKERYHSEKHRIAGLKQILDGVIEANTALLREPYQNNPQLAGEAAFAQEDLNGMVLEAAKAGYSVKLHAIGDKACMMGLDAFENAIKVLGDQKLHHSLEHMDVIQLCDIERMAQMNIMGSVQPQHTTGDYMCGGYIGCIGEKRLSGAWPFREMLDHGVKLAFGTDYPAVYSVNPIWTLYAAVTRCEPEGGMPEAGYYKEHAVTLAEAIQAHTKYSAYAESFEQDLGTLEKGKLADLIVIDRNLFAIDPKDIRFAQVVLTMMDGRIVYRQGYLKSIIP